MKTFTAIARTLFVMAFFTGMTASYATELDPTCIPLTPEPLPPTSTPLPTSTPFGTPLPVMIPDCPSRTPTPPPTPLTPSPPTETPEPTEQPTPQIPLPTCPEGEECCYEIETRTPTPLVTSTPTPTPLECGTGPTPCCIWNNEQMVQSPFCPQVCPDYNEILQTFQHTESGQCWEYEDLEWAEISYQYEHVASYSSGACEGVISLTQERSCSYSSSLGGGFPVPYLNLLDLTFTYQKTNTSSVTWYSASLPCRIVTLHCYQPKAIGRYGHIQKKRPCGSEEDWYEIFKQVDSTARYIRDRNGVYMWKTPQTSVWCHNG